MYNTVIFFIFVVKILSFASQQMKLIYSNILLHWKFFTTNIYKNRSVVVWIIEFTCMCSAMSLSLVFPCRYCVPVAIDSLLQPGYVSLRLFQSIGQTSRSKRITIAKCTIYCYSFCQSGSADSDRGRELTHWLPRISECEIVREEVKSSVWSHRAPRVGSQFSYVPKHQDFGD